MAFESVFLSRARKEISNAVDWYEDRQKGLGEEFFFEVETEIQRIFQNPLLFPISHITKTEFRKAILPRFPYLIIFSISKELVIIHSVFHSHLNPNKKPLE